MVTSCCYFVVVAVGRMVSAVAARVEVARFRLLGVVVVVVVPDVVVAVETDVGGVVAVAAVGCGTDRIVAECI